LACTLPFKAVAAPRVLRFLRALGPGLITGAADDDPSGISTYSVAGAGFGYGVLWTALLSFPLMAAVQLMCARLGLVTGQGLAGILRKRIPAWLLWGICLLLSAANTFNIGADLAGMASVSQMVTGIDARFWGPVYAIAIAAFLIWSSYSVLARIFKWLTLLLFAYPLAAFFAHPDWPAVLRATFVPHFERSPQYWATLVGVLGTTISPYLFFWQAAEEIEESREQGVLKKPVRAVELRNSRTDVVSGMFFSNLIMYFILLTSAATLHAHGMTKVSTARDAAEALRPLAGNAAYWLFSMGLIGAGMIGVPVLAGSSGYVLAEAGRWRGSFSDRPSRAPKFYFVIVVSLAIGLTLALAGFNAVSLLFWSAVVNGVLAPPLIVIVLLLTGSRNVMGQRRNPAWLSILGWLAAALMTGAAIAMFAT